METVLAHAFAACSAASGTTGQATGGGGGSAAGITSFDLVGLLVSAGLLAVLAVGITLAIVIANRLSDRPIAVVPVPVSGPISPDGYFWWDGTAWRPRL